jgi:thiol-disulfide isomerase/thioredoxin
MKLRLLLIIFIFFNKTVALRAQIVEEILQKTYIKCQSINYGYYEMTRFFKFMDSKDTSKSNSTCYFKKLINDDLNLPVFRYDNGDISLYTGNELVEIQSWNRTAIILSKDLWSKKIERESRRFNFYAPLTNQKYPIIQHDSDFNNKKYIFKLIGVENFKNDNCYHVQVNNYNSDISEDMKTIAIEYNYWIKKSDFMPIQYSIEYTNVFHNDTTYQFEKNVLDKYEINILKDENIFALNSLPPTYKLKDYIPTNSPKLLPNDTIAPNWELLSLKNEKINLKDLRGQLVMIDFFTKSCYPCMLALPGLQSIHEKYKTRGLKVIGINIYDKKEDCINTFLSKHGITYTVLLGGKDVGINYNVSGIPTIYLIDKNGKIIFSIDGYEKGQEEILERLIKMNL